MRTFFAWFYIQLPSFMFHLPRFSKFIWCDVSQCRMYPRMIVIPKCICNYNFSILIVCKLVRPDVLFFQCLVEWLDVTVLLRSVVPDELLSYAKKLYRFRNFLLMYCEPLSVRIVSLEISGFSDAIAFTTHCTAASFVADTSKQYPTHFLVNVSMTLNR